MHSNALIGLGILKTKAGYVFPLQWPDPCIDLILFWLLASSFMTLV
jgi:hypothetical protein